MIDLKFLRENPDVVRQNIRNKFQDAKLPLVDEVLELDARNRAIKAEVEALRYDRNKGSKSIGMLMGQGKREEAEEMKKRIAALGADIDRLTAEEREVEEKLLHARLSEALLHGLLVEGIVVREEESAVAGDVVPEPGADLELVDEKLHVESRGRH